MNGQKTHLLCLKGPHNMATESSSDNERPVDLDESLSHRLFELEEGENWLRLVPKDSRHSILDDTQDLSSSQETPSQPYVAYYPSIWSLASVGGPIHVTDECYLCLDVDGDVLAIKDMRLTTKTTADSSVTGDLETDDGGNERAFSNGPPAGLWRKQQRMEEDANNNAKNRGWQLLPLRQLRILKPGDRIATFFDKDMQSIRGGLVLEYQHCEAQPQRRREMEEESTSQPLGNPLGLFTQPPDDDSNYDSDKTTEMTQTETSLPYGQPSQALSTQPLHEQDDRDNGQTKTKSLIHAASQNSEATKIPDSNTSDHGVEVEVQARAAQVDAWNESERMHEVGTTQKVGIGATNLQKPAAAMEVEDQPPESPDSEATETAPSEERPVHVDNNDERKEDMVSVQMVKPSTSPKSQSNSKDNNNTSATMKQMEGHDSVHAEAGKPKQSQSQPSRRDKRENLENGTESTVLEASKSLTEQEGSLLQQEAVNDSVMHEGKIFPAPEDDHHKTAPQKDTTGAEEEEWYASTQELITMEGGLRLRPQGSEPRQMAPSEEHPVPISANEELANHTGRCSGQKLYSSLEPPVNSKQEDEESTNQERPERKDHPHYHDKAVPSSRAEEDGCGNPQNGAESAIDKGSSISKDRVRSLKVGGVDPGSQQKTHSVKQGHKQSSEQANHGIDTSALDGKKSGAEEVDDAINRGVGGMDARAEAQEVADCQDLQSVEDTLSEQYTAPVSGKVNKKTGVESRADLEDQQDDTNPDEDKTENAVAATEPVAAPDFKAVSTNASASWKTETAQCSINYETEQQIAASQDISLSMLRETGEDTPSFARAKARDVDNDSDITDVDDPTPSKLVVTGSSINDVDKASTRERKEDDDSEITDIECPVEKNVPSVEKEAPSKPNDKTAVQNRTGDKPKAVMIAEKSSAAEIEATKRNNSAATKKIELPQAKKDYAMRDTATEGMEERANSEYIKKGSKIPDRVRDEDKKERKEVVDNPENKKRPKRHRRKGKISLSGNARDDSSENSVKGNRDETDCGNGAAQELEGAVPQEKETKPSRGTLKAKRKLDDFTSPPTSTTKKTRTSARKPKAEATPRQTPASLSSQQTVSRTARKRTRGTPIGAELDFSDVGLKEESVRVMATGVTLDKGMVEKMGGVVIENISDASTATHVIAASAEVPLKRTPKLMVALSRTDQIVHFDWLKACAEKGQILPTEKFLLIKGPVVTKAEEQYDFKMKQTIERGRKLRTDGRLLFEDLFFYLCAGVAGNTSKTNRTPSEVDFRLILEAAGGKVLTVLPEKLNDEGVTVILTSKLAREKNKQTKVNKVAKAISSGAVTKTTEEVFHAVMTQQPFDEEAKL